MFNKKLKPITVTIYRPTADFDLISSRDAATIAISLSQYSFHSYGYILPDGVWLADSQYDRLPSTVQHLFAAESVTLEPDGK